MIPLDLIEYRCGKQSTARLFPFAYLAVVEVAAEGDVADEVRVVHHVSEKPEGRGYS